MKENPENIYGRCPLGHNPVADGATGDNLSTNEISDNEELPLYWSNYHQKYICKICLNKVEDISANERITEKSKKELELNARLGYEQL